MVINGQPHVLATLALGKSPPLPHCPLNRRLGGSWSLSGHSGRENYHAPTRI